MKSIRHCAWLFCLLLTHQAFGADNVIEDAGVGMSREELEFVVRHWTPQMQQAAAVDRGDRIELLNLALTTKKIAAEADAIGPAPDPEAWWQLQYAIINKQRQFVKRHYMNSLEIPDMTKLAAERYQTEKDKFALVPERRMTSHILVRCLPGNCVRKEKRALANELLEKLRGGADFGALVEEYSEDPGSRKKGGKFDKWLSPGEPHVAPTYVQAAFELEKVGDYSEVVPSQFGFHVIRLDAIEPAYHKPYEEVRNSIIATLEREYKQMAAKEFENRYLFTDDVHMDEAALDAIFAQYRPVTPPAGTAADPNAPAQPAASGVASE